MNIRESMILGLRYLFYGTLYKMRRNIAVSHDTAFLRLYDEVTGARRLTMNFTELYNLYRLVRGVTSVPGDIAELGVFRGASARVICAVKGTKALHLFDTFAGLPDVHGKDQTDVKTAISEGRRQELAMAKGKFDAAFEDVRSYLSPYPDVHFHKGFFPDTAAPVTDARFSFVHLDADLYQSTLDGLRFFYPRLSSGGIVLSHDYATVSCPGVKRAFDEFFADKPERLYELWDTQVMVVKA